MLTLALAVNYAEYSYTSPVVRYPCAIVDFSEAVKRGANAYANSFKSPLIYTRGAKIGFFPQSIGAVANGYQHYYYKQPSTVASGVEYTLQAEAHEGILLIAYSFALLKDVKANEYLEKGLKILEGLC